MNFPRELLEIILRFKTRQAVKERLENILKFPRLKPTWDSGWYGGYTEYYYTAFHIWKVRDGYDTGHICQQYLIYRYVLSSPIVKTTDYKFWLVETTLDKWRAIIELRRP